MPAFFAFKARDDDDDEPFERGIPLTQDPTLYGGGKNIFVRFVLLVDLVSTYAVAYRYHDPNGRIELDADYMISTDSGPCFRYCTYMLDFMLSLCVCLSPVSLFLCVTGLTAPAVNGGAPPAFDWKVAHAHCIDVTERTTRHDSKVCWLFFLLRFVVLKIIASESSPPRIFGSHSPSADKYARARYCSISFCVIDDLSIFLRRSA